MKIWLIKTGESIPLDEKNPRLYRTGILNAILIENGHDVIWWNSTFNHAELKHRFTNNQEINLANNGKLILLHGCGYRKNISILRFLDHFQVARQFELLAQTQEKPDIILCAFPTIALCSKAIKYGRRHNIPVLIDYRDLWPEVFVNILPKKLHRLGNVLFYPLFNKVANIFKEATGITSITQPILNLALKKAERKQNKFDSVFPLAYEKPSTSQPDKEAQTFWEGMNIFKNDKQFIICYFGKIGYQFDLKTVIEAAKICRSENIKFIFCGSGDNLAFYKNLSRDLNNVIFTGQVNKSQIIYLMSIANIGIAPYKNSLDFNSSFPNKAIEYMAGKLPILTSLWDGHLGEYIQEKNIGFVYKNNESESLAKLIDKLEQNKDVLKSMGEQAYILFEERFEANKVYSSYCFFLEKVAAQFFFTKASKSIL
jgi:glycosyltransferase involved in cell wall biosynthesis